jgi:hypothetical protein
MRSLGLVNVGRVLTYRLLLRSGLHPAQRLHERQAGDGPWFRRVTHSTALQPPPRWSDAPGLFGWHAMSWSGVPDWHRNVLTGAVAGRQDAPWWRIPDFDPALGDVKGIWEPSRFDWVVNLAQRAAAGDDTAHAALESWLGDWCRRNPPYRGHNWKCGQEASIRVLHLALAAMVTAQIDDAERALAELVAVHLRRIAPTIAYARGQSNNHGTSEAAALYIGGSWLERTGDGTAARWTALGRRLLEDRARALIEPDGSFSQYSVNYHRLMLDTYALAEVWRRRCRLPPFSRTLYDRLVAATEWLRALVDASNGDAPVLGANDGALLLRLTDADFRDHRPSVELASALFLDASAFGSSGAWREHLRWLGMPTPERQLAPPASRAFDDGGFAVLRVADATAVLRYPRFRFRPSHADALHVDLSVRGRNLLRDGGSFSYFEPEWNAYFSGASGHSGVQFDQHEQMPRLGRFLWGGWLRTSHLEPVRENAGLVTAGAAYEDRFGVRHLRQLELGQDSLTIRDHVGGFRDRAVLRFRLQPMSWQLTDGVFRAEGDELRVSAGDRPLAMRLVEGWESRYYGRRTPVPIAEVTMGEPGVIESVYRWRR